MINNLDEVVMVHSVNFNRLPPIFGIEPKIILVAFVTSLCVQLFIKAVSCIYINETVPTRHRFWQIRNKIAKFDHSTLRKRLPQVYHFIHSSIKDNAAIVSFIATVIILKNPEKMKHKFIIACACVLSCSTLDTLRNIVYCILLKISLKFHANNWDKTAKRINEIALRIRQSL